MKGEAKYQFSSSMKEGVLEVVITGELTENTYEDVVKETNTIIKANNANKVIVDSRGIDRRMEPSEFYRYFRNYHAVIFDIKYAIVDLSQNIRYKDAAIDAGLKSLKWFTDIEDARKWIKSNLER